MKPNYDFSPLNTKFPIIDLETIMEFKVCDKIYILGNFKSLDDAYNFLTENKKDLTYIKYVDDLNVLSVNGKVNSIENCTTKYIKNGNYHKLDGPAVIDVYSSFKNEFFYIDGVEIEKKDFEKHPKVRQEKLKRILKQ